MQDLNKNIGWLGYLNSRKIGTFNTTIIQESGFTFYNKIV